MTNTEQRLKKLVYSSVAGALYAVLTMTFYPISYGPVQFRISECLCILPFFSPVFVPGLFVGCIIANLLSSAGLLDIVFGSLATLLAAMITAQIGKKGTGWLSCILACLPPVIVNALVVGAVLAFSGAGGEKSFGALFGLYALQVGAGEAAVLLIPGLLLLRILLRKNWFMDKIRQISG